MQLAVPYGQFASVTRLPSSHTSLLDEMLASPHTLPVRLSAIEQSSLHSVQVCVPYGHAFSVITLPSSQVSTRGATVSRKPSPHALATHELRQLSVSIAFMSSHASPAIMFVVPSPHSGTVQFASHVIVSTPPSSQS